MKTKICIILSALICLSVVKVSAQVRLGAEAGVNLARLGVRGDHRFACGWFDNRLSFRE